MLDQTNQTALIDIRSVSRSFPKGSGEQLLVLENVDLTIHAGEIVGLLGRSGSGKSTLLRIIAGLVAPSSGAATCRGEAIAGPPNGVAMVFQSFALFPWLTVLQNVELGLEALGEHDRRRAITGTLAVVLSQVLGMMLAAVVLLPAFAHFPDTARSLGMTYNFASLGSVHPLQLLDMFVVGAASQLGGDLDLDFDRASFYVGALTLPLAGVGLLAGRRPLEVALAAALVLIGLLAAGRHAAHRRTPLSGIGPAGGARSRASVSPRGAVDRAPGAAGSAASDGRSGRPDRRSHGAPATPDRRPE